MFLLAQTSTVTSSSLVQQIHNFIPLDKILATANQITPAFVLVGVGLMAIGYLMNLMKHDLPFRPTVKFILLMAVTAGSPWVLGIVESIATGLVNVVGASNPALNWLIVNNPGETDLALNFGQPYQVIGQYLHGQSANAPGFFQMGAWANYLIRLLFAAIASGFAVLAVTVMEVMLVIQKLILVFGRPLMPLAIGALFIPAAKQAGETFLKFTVSACVWPIGWALLHTGTMAGLRTLHPPDWNASFGTLLAAVLQLALICLWMVWVAARSPKLITRAISSGAHLVAEAIGGAAGSASSHAGNVVKAGATAGGAALGIPGGAAGIAAGAYLGSAAGGALSAPIGSAIQGIEGVNAAHGANEGRQAVPSSKSRALADQAVKGLGLLSKAPKKT
jgi:hypothetical protein